ncbi:MAG: DUF4214 domain-containing protein [Clostridiales bacterium]|nr:DUF4214 domain-containing protein [Clostridiales bacterium]
MNLKIRSAKIISSALAVTMGIALIPWLNNGTDVRADGTKNKDNTKLGVSQIADPSIPDDFDTPWEGSYIYLGKYDGNPIKFRVLDTDSEIYGNGKKTVFLDCDSVLFTAPLFNSAPEGITIDEIGRYEPDDFYSKTLEEWEEITNEYTWKNSDLRNYLNGEDFLNNENVFSGAEQNSIINSYVENHKLTMGNEAGNVDFCAMQSYDEFIGLTGEKIFILDVEELLNESYGYYLPKLDLDYNLSSDGIRDLGSKTDSCSEYSVNRVKDKNYGYWTRSRYNTSERIPLQYRIHFYACDIYSVGYMWYDSIFDTRLGVSPALNLDSDSILFSTVISGTYGQPGAEYKLTLKDSDLNLVLSSSAYYSGNTVTVPYSISGLDSSKASQISVLISNKAYSDSDAEIIYYDTLEVMGDLSSGTGTFTLPEGLGTLGTDYHVYVFAEDINGDQESDYASVPIELTNILPSSGEESNVPNENTSSDNEGQIQDNTNTNPAENDGTQPPSQINPAPNKPTETETEKQSFDAFVERLYTVALGRESENEGKAFWCENVKNGSLTGADCAREFLNSTEFKNKNLSDEDFVKVLYSTFFNRDAQNDPDGYSFWLNSLKTEGRDKVINDFINSTEWCNVCASYGVRSGAIAAKATQASENASAFATRLYSECLGRDPEQDGLNYWSLALTNLDVTGTQAAKEFFYSKEFLNNNYDNEEYLNRLYATFMGRQADENGFAYWLDLLNNGTSRDKVFESFSTSPEFKDICSNYAILP